MKLKKVYGTGGNLGKPATTTDFDTVPSYLYYLKAAKENNTEGMKLAYQHINHVRGPETAAQMEFLSRDLKVSSINDIAKRRVGGETNPQMKILYAHINENPDALNKFDITLPRNKDLVAKFDTGGQMYDNRQAITGGITTGLGGIGLVADALDTPDEYGTQSTGTNVLKSAATFAGIGSALGPIGAGIGAGVGALVGLFSSNKEKEAKKRQIAAEQQKKYATQAAQGTAIVTANPSLVSGNENASYYRNGGKLIHMQQMLATKGNQFGKGGSLKQISSESQLVQGPSHEQGGVNIGPNEVEGNETIKNGFVFSDSLGFADIHKPIAKKIGIIEKKAPSRERLTSLNRLRQQEDSLAVLQEQYKAQNNV